MWKTTDNSGSRVRGVGTNIDVNPINIGNNTFIFTQFGINSFEVMPFINVDTSGVNLSAFDISFVQNDLNINSPIWLRNQPTSPNANNQNANRPPNANNQTSNNRPTNANNQNTNRPTNATSANQATNATNANRPNATSATRAAEQNRIANTITLDRIRGLYPDIRKKRTLDALVDAHRAVLAHGQQTGNELLIVINSGTGETVLSQSGIINNVTFDLERIRNQSVILVHNHPNDMAFSPADINTLNIRSDIDYISVQTPSGRMYSLSRGDGGRASENHMNTIRTRFQQLDDGKSLSADSTIELNRRIANLLNWNLIID